MSYGFPLPPGEVCPTGSFLLSLQTGRSEWSEGLYRMHGYARGDVVPTRDLVIAHMHPEDRDAARQLIETLARDGGQASNFHRIIDSKGKEHRVLTVAEADRDDTGKVVAIHGLTVDLTRSMAIESGQAAALALVNAYASRGVIEQAKGILMGYFNIGPAEAFDRLAARSQNTNVKVSALAAQLVAAADNRRIHDTLGKWVTQPRGHQMSTQ
ncbi:PAS and ANTAR domain-containing protein [Paenarthrobacter sp. PAE-2]|uniref:PAS and ANTAR domain-containing protein n=1 Tax=Paenarthrobacter sp. PAE-2 TaxID=2982532 RepID=UPI0022328820|nr:PAS and ANTAR domain-containing protein [Paenarthrobacter sp. PAE-2]MCW3768896.1 PAS and ANTAR domain-containing protein [Paenarthrobacter sp. PAE-2]